MILSSLKETAKQNQKKGCRCSKGNRSILITQGYVVVSAESKCSRFCQPLTKGPSQYICALLHGHVCISPDVWQAPHELLYTTSAKVSSDASMSAHPHFCRIYSGLIGNQEAAHLKHKIFATQTQSNLWTGREFPHHL